MEHLRARRVPGQRHPLRDRRGLAHHGAHASCVGHGAGWRNGLGSLRCAVQGLETDTRTKGLEGGVSCLVSGRRRAPSVSIGIPTWRTHEAARPRRRDRRDDGREQAAPPAAAHEWDDHRRRPRRRAPLPARATCSSRSAPTTATSVGALAARLLARRRRPRARRDRPGRPRRSQVVLLADGRTPRLRLPGHRHRHLAAAGPDARHARPRVAAQHLRLLHPRRRRGAGRRPCDVRPRPPRRARHRHADQVPRRAAGVHLPRRGLAARARAARPGRAGLRHPARRARSPSRSPPTTSARCSRSARSSSSPTSSSSASTTSARRWSPTTSARCPFDLLVTVPLNMGADFVARSGLGDELNYVPVDKHTLQSTAHANVFAVGDASDIPDLQGGIGRALLGGDLRRQLPRAHRRAAR